MLSDRELEQMDAAALRGYISVLHEAVQLQANAGAQAAQLVNRSRGMNRQANRMSSDNPMLQLALAMAGGAR